MLELESILRKKNCTPVLIGRVGSKAYGTDNAESDDDYMAIVLPDSKYYLGLESWGQNGTWELKVANGEPVDLVAYELKKALNLLLKFNPNIVPLPWLREEDYIYVEPYLGRMLINNREAFNSISAYKTFVKYAENQIDHVKKGLTGKLGQKRKGIVEKYGYDVKFAMHTIRLLNMIIEFGETGKLQVWRGDKDASTLKSIRNGEWPEDLFYEIAEKLVQMANLSMEDTVLPLYPDYEFIEQMCIDMVSYCLHNEILPKYA